MSISARIKFGNFSFWIVGVFGRTILRSYPPNNITNLELSKLQVQNL